MKFLLVLLFIFFLAIHSPAIARREALSVNEWVKKMADPNDKENKCYYSLSLVLDKLDSNSVFTFLNQLAGSADAKGDFFLARYHCIKANEIYLKSLATPNTVFLHDEKIEKEVTQLLAHAMQIAYESNNDYLTAFVSSVYGRYMSIFGKTEAAVMYMMNSAELFEKLNLPAQYGTYVVLGEMLWRVREYEKCIHYTHKAIDQLQTLENNDRDINTIFCSNTMALAFHRMAQYDSAFVYYRQALKAAEKISSLTWKGIISGNLGQIYFIKQDYGTALPLFEMDYTISKEQGYYDNAANSLQWAARTNLSLGKTDIALRQVREAFQLLQKWPSPNYQQNAYFTATEIFKALKNNDSSFYYAGQYTKLHDSLEKVIYQSSVSISKLRLDDEKSRYSILSLQREKQAQVEQRNLIIVIILFLTAVALLLINRQRLKLKYQQRLAVEEKLRTEQEMVSAKAQLQLFTQNIIEKTNLIEQLEQQVQNKTASKENQQVITELSNQTILTEEDWDKFRSLFEKIFPLFFQRLKNKAADITMAEQRMSALTRLQLTARQMASMLGISVDSVHKTRQRLRKRFDLDTDANLEEYITNICG